MSQSSGNLEPTSPSVGSAKPPSPCIQNLRKQALSVTSSSHEGKWLITCNADI